MLFLLGIVIILELFVIIVILYRKDKPPLERPRIFKGKAQFLDPESLEEKINKIFNA